MRARGPGLGLISKPPGGSSGVPLHFALDRQSNDRRTAAWHRGYAWAGAGPGERQLYLWGVPLTARSPLKRCKDRLYDWLYRKRVFNSFDMSRQREDAFVRQLNSTRPDAIIAYANPLYELARSLTTRGVRVYSPKSIVVGAEKLHAFQRELIERAFGAPVFETYGSREFMLIGAECEHRTGPVRLPASLAPPHPPRRAPPPRPPRARSPPPRGPFRPNLSDQNPPTPGRQPPRRGHSCARRCPAHTDRGGRLMRVLALTN